jgi:UDP-N-acetylglucosamine 3-dehydrogenase
LGRFGQNHLRTWRKLAAEIVVCDHDPRHLAGVSERTATNWLDVLDEVDAVDIVTPAHAHAEMIRTALARGKHVFVEKPVTSASAEGFALAREARARGLVLQVGHVFRFSPEAQAVARSIRAGELGRLRYAIAHFMSFKRPRTDGGIAISDGVHFVDLVSWLFGKQPTGVSAVLHDHLGRGTDDVAVLSLDYGAEKALVEAACFPPAGQRDLQVMGTEGAIACDFVGAADRVRHFAHRHVQGENAAWSATEGATRVLETPGEEPLLAELRAFLEACGRGKASEIAADGFAGAAAVAVIEAACRSAREGRRIELALPEEVRR